MIEFKAMENQADKDLEKKLQAEKQFKKELTALFASMVADFRITVARTGMAPDANTYMPAFTQLLKKQYARVQNKFKGDVLDFNDLTISPELQDEINFLLLEWSNNAAPQQAAQITQTNQNNMQQSISKAIEENMDDGMAFNNRLVAATGAALLRKKFKGRVENIAVFETQGAAENTKFVEADTVQRSKIAKFIKSWITKGDKLVRATHRAANRQIRKLKQAFNVGGAKLMWPRDTSLGAPMKEVANCLHPETKIGFATPCSLFRRLYDGQMVTIECATGYKITVTPDHLILCKSGWVKAKEINHRHKVIQTTPIKVSVANRYIENTYISAEEMFNTLSDAGNVVRVAGSVVNFHGDIPNHDVDIVNIEGELLDSLKPRLSDPFGKHGLTFSDIIKVSKSSNRSFFHKLESFFNAFNRFISSLNSFFYFGLGHVFKHVNIGFASIPNLDAINLEDFNYSTPCEPSFLMDGQNGQALMEKRSNSIEVNAVIPNKGDSARLAFRLPNILKNTIKHAISKSGFIFNNMIRDAVKVQFSNVISIGKHSYSGYIYNLEDKKSYYIAEGFVNHNCRCSALYKAEK